MTHSAIARLEKEGRLRRRKVGFVQVEAMLKQAILELEEARKTAEIAERATYVFAYMAMLKAGRALLLLEGYVPADGGQHRTVVEATTALLGKKYQGLTDQFESMRRKRNEMTDEAGALLSKSESKKALAEAIRMVRSILDRVKSQNPQLELDFE